MNELFKSDKLTQHEELEREIAHLEWSIDRDAKHIIQLQKKLSELNGEVHEWDDYDD